MLALRLIEGVVYCISNAGRSGPMEPARYKAQIIELSLFILSHSCTEQNHSSKVCQFASLLVIPVVYAQFPTFRTL